jgi:hypothetical protein
MRWAQHDVCIAHVAIPPSADPFSTHITPGSRVLTMCDFLWTKPSTITTMLETHHLFSFFIATESFLYLSRGKRGTETTKRVCSSIFSDGRRLYLQYQLSSSKTICKHPNSPNHTWQSIGSVMWRGNATTSRVVVQMQQFKWLGTSELYIQWWQGTRNQVQSSYLAYNPCFLFLLIDYIVKWSTNQMLIKSAILGCSNPSKYQNISERC